MLDAGYVRDHIDDVRAGLRNRGLQPDAELEQIVTLETRRRRLIPEMEGLKREQNAAGDEVARAKRQGKDASEIFAANKARAVQIRQLEPGFSTAEWGIAVGSQWWGKGLFEDTGRLVLRFAFETLGVHRLEARVATQNARGNAAVGKLGATAEGLLRRALRTADGTTHDQILWAWLNDEWRRDEAKRLAEELVWVH